MGRRSEPDLLQRAPVPAAATAPRKAGQPPWSARALDFTPRVLVAEDNVINQKVAVRMLEKLDLRVDVAGNGREAVEMFRLLPYDLILMDCQMPKMDGYAAAREIRRPEAADRRPVIVAMTAEAMTGIRERCLDAGMDDDIAKPVKPESLCEILRTRLKAPLGMGKGALLSSV